MELDEEIKCKQEKKEKKEATEANREGKGWNKPGNRTNF